MTLLAPAESTPRGAPVVVRSGGAGALRPPPPSSSAGPRVPTLIGLGEEDGDDFYSRQTLPNLRLPPWQLPREFEIRELEQTPEPFFVTPRPPKDAARYLDRNLNRPATLLDGVDDDAARSYMAQAERLAGRIGRNPEPRASGIVATLTAFVEELWQALLAPAANK